MHARACLETLRPYLQAKGTILGTIEAVSSVQGPLLENGTLRMLGWTGNIEDGVDDRLWRTLVANRSPNGKIAPTWYRRACALALSKPTTSGDLTLSKLLAQTSESSTMLEYLKRVRMTTRYRRAFRCHVGEQRLGQSIVGNVVEEAIVGLGNFKTRADDMVCILFGCSVPLVLRRVLQTPQREGKMEVELIDACYVHNHMEGEMFAEMSKKEVEAKTTEFQIY